MLFLSISILSTFSACKNKDASVLKIYIRSKNNELLADTKVVIIGDVKSNPPTKEYVDTASTNASGYATFDMQPYFDLAGEKENPTGYFDIVFKYVYVFLLYVINSPSSFKSLFVFVNMLREVYSN